jgi:hypothetical protein
MPRGRTRLNQATTADDTCYQVYTLCPCTQRKHLTPPPRLILPLHDIRLAAAARCLCCSSTSGARQGLRAVRSRSPARRARTRTYSRARARSPSPCVRISPSRQNDNDKEGALIERELVTDARVRAREEGERVGEEARDGLDALGQLAVRPPPWAERSPVSHAYAETERHKRRTSTSSRPGPRAPRSCSRAGSGSRRRPQARSARSRGPPRACP